MPLDVVMLNDEPEEGDGPSQCQYPHDPNRRRLYAGPGHIKPLSSRVPKSFKKPQIEEYNKAWNYHFRLRQWHQRERERELMLAQQAELTAGGAIGYCKTCGILVRANGVPDDSVMPCDLIDCPFEGRG